MEWICLSGNQGSKTVLGLKQVDYFLEGKQISMLGSRQGSEWIAQPSRYEYVYLVFRTR